MKLSRHNVNERTSGSNESVWAVDSCQLQNGVSLSSLLQLSATEMFQQIDKSKTDHAVTTPTLAPVDEAQEVWAAGVTYLKSREARMEESDTADVYDKVYDADRPEVFFKANGWRVRGFGEAVRIRRDSKWNVPEPELAIVINASGDIVGYTAGNDVSSRSIEGENPLYLPQAKVYDGSAALGDAIVLGTDLDLHNLDIQMRIERKGEVQFEGKTSTSQLKRTVRELADCLCQELDFPHGVILMTGTCLVPADPYTLQVGDEVSISVGEASLRNLVET